MPARPKSPTKSTKPSAEPARYIAVIVPRREWHNDPFGFGASDRSYDRSRENYFLR